MAGKILGADCTVVIKQAKWCVKRCIPTLLCSWSCPTHSLRWL